MRRQENQAKRNLELAKKLLSEGGFYDWVVTAAFYSAVHAIENCCLPCKVNEKTCTNIADVSRAYNAQSRHQAREWLAKEKLSFEVASAYKWLDDRSRTSRYLTYKIHKSIAAKAVDYAELIINTQNKKS